MITIYKYQIQSDEQKITMPAGASILCFQLQNTVPTIWAMVDIEQPVEVRSFRIYGTGWEMDELMNLRYIGTIQSESLVWHLFEEKLAP